MSDDVGGTTESGLSHRSIRQIRQRAAFRVLAVEMPRLVLCSVRLLDSTYSGSLVEVAVLADQFQYVKLLVQEQHIL